LWRAVAEIAAQRGMKITSRVLHLDANSLRKWINKRAGQAQRPAEPKRVKRKYTRRKAAVIEAPATFLELLAPSPGSAASCIMEVESPRGGKLKCRKTQTRLYRGTWHPIQPVPSAAIASAAALRIALRFSSLGCRAIEAPASLLIDNSLSISFIKPEIQTDGLHPYEPSSHLTVGPPNFSVEQILKTGIIRADRTGTALAKNFGQAVRNLRPILKRLEVALALRSSLTLCL
jgi:hypothetical protein